MTPWAEVKEHSVDNLTLLCDQHHREKGANLLPIEQVRLADAKPHNRTTGTSEALGLHYGSEEIVLEVGSCRLIPAGRTEMAAITIYGQDLIAFRIEDGHCLISVHLTDREGQLSVVIEDNELIYTAEAWDVEFTRNRLIVRSNAREIAASLVFEPPHKLIVKQVNMIYKGVPVQVDAEWVQVAGSQFGDIEMIGCHSIIEVY